MSPNVLSMIVYAQLIVIIVLLLLVRYLWISPSFGIAGQAAGKLKVLLTFGPVIWTYIDIDQLGKVNAALTITGREGAIRWNQLMSELLTKVRASDMFLIYGGDEFGFATRVKLRLFFDKRRMRNDGIAFGLRLQYLMTQLSYSEDEKAALLAATGNPYVTCTVASAYSPGWWYHRGAIRAAGARVAVAKPKDSIGERGGNFFVEGV